jgi:tRNA(Ile)-lysidine synthase
MATQAPALTQKLLERWPRERWRGLTIVVGCSGGADSTALLLALEELRPADTTLITAHFNHRLRGQESEDDLLFVESLARRLGCGFISNRPSSSPEEDLAESSEGARPRDEASLREARYAFLTRVAAECGARYVAVAHTADDSVETTLHHLVRGTGLRGLAGIRPYRDLNEDLVLIRPLLDVWRWEVEAYLAKRGQAFREDSSNRQTDYTRNRLRHRLLPVIVEEFGESTKAAIYRSSLILAEVADWLAAQAADYLSRAILEEGPERVQLSLAESPDAPWPVVQQALVTLWQRQGWPLQAMSCDHWLQLRKGWENPKGASWTSVLPGKIKVVVAGQHWSLERGEDFPRRLS